MAQTGWSTLGPPVALAFAYFLGAVLAFAVGTLSDRIFAPFWPPNAILFAALFFTAPRRWPVFVLAALPAHVAAESLVQMAAPQMMVAFATNVLVAVLNATLIRRLIGRTGVFADLKSALIYLVVAVAVVPAVSAIPGALVRIAEGGEWSSYWPFWFDWFSSNAVGFLTLGPLLLIWLEPGGWTRRSRGVPSAWEVRLMSAGLIVSSAAGAWIATLQVAPDLFPGVAYLYLPLPFKLWAAVRGGAKGASAAVVVGVVVSIWLAMNGSTVFSGDSLEDTARILQIFLAVDATAILLLGVSIDQLRHSEQENRRISHHLLDAADEERRRIARDLHDSTAGTLHAAAMLLDRLEAPGSNVDRSILGPAQDLLRSAMREVRTISYVLHPPLLDEGGLRLAIENYVAGFVERSGITVDFDISSVLLRLPKDVELALFRVAQEALTNIARHSAATFARISIEPAADGLSVTMVVEDFGKGIVGLTVAPKVIDGATKGPFAQGLGLRGIAERVSQVGGRIEISSRAGRTVLRTHMPMSQTARRSAG